jgi:hypothetical protein
MARPKHGYPPKLFIQVGRVATTTAFIEQEFILWTSALHAQSTGGKPTENLRMGFSRLLNKWWAQAQKRLDAKDVNKVVRPIYDDLREMWPTRNIIIHGTWYPQGRSRYRLNLWEQQNSLERIQLTLTLGELRRIADAFDRVLQRLYLYFDRLKPAPPRKSSARQAGNRRPRRASPAKP